MMRVKVLGALEVVGSQLGPPKQKALLALLLVRAGTVVPVDQLIYELWEDQPPPSALVNVRSYASGLRRLLTAAAGPVLAKRGPGYQMEISRPDEFDLPRWRELADAGRTTLRNGDLPTAAAHLKDALALWRGPALADVPLGPALTAWQTSVHEQRIAAVEDYTDTVLRLGAVDQAAGQARELLATAPLRERSHALLMRARYQAGDIAGALEAYDTARRVLVESLGIEPGYDLQRLHRAILNRDEKILAAQPSRASVTVTPSRGERAVPRQLPADVSSFIGRTELLSALNTLSARDFTAVVAAIAGMPGVGKTAVAVHWAHRAANSFPDGQVYVNLRGFAPGDVAMSPSEAIRSILEAFEVAPQRIPASLDAQVGLYRGLLDGRRVLLVLDNARDSEQVRPLLPRGPGCLALVTSRSRLSGLLVDGAHPMTVDLLSIDDARDMMANRLGDHRVNAEPEAVDEIITLCSRLPMALAIVAARAAAHPDFTLADLAKQLRHSRLDGLDSGDPVTSIRSVFSWSYQALSPSTAALFRLLGLHPGLDITARAASSLAGLPRMHQALAELAHAHLIIEHSPGRYTFHDLLREYADELAEETDSADCRRTATRRILDHHLHTAYAADRLLRPDREPIDLGPPAPGVTPDQAADHHDALAWFAAEHPVLLAAIQQAVRTGHDTHAWQLAWTLENFFDWRGHWHDLATAQRAALKAATRLGDPAACAHIHRGLARADLRAGRYESTLAHLKQALELFTQIGDRAGQAATHRSLGVVLTRQHHYQAALIHDENALRLHRATGDVAGQALMLNNMGYHHALSGNHEEALAYCQEALVLHQNVGARDGEARTWASLGYARSHLGQHAKAIDCYRRAIEILGDLGDRTSKAEQLGNLGDAHQAAGDVASARAVWRQTLNLFTELGHPDAAKMRERLGTPATA